MQYVRKRGSDWGEREGFERDAYGIFRVVQTEKADWIFETDRVIELLSQFYAASGIPTIHIVDNT